MNQTHSNDNTYSLTIGINLGDIIIFQYFDNSIYQNKYIKKEEDVERLRE